MQTVIVSVILFGAITYRRQDANIY